MVLNLISIPSKPEEIENPNPIIYAHYTLKGLQTGIFVGSGLQIINNLYDMYLMKTENKFNWMKVGSNAGLFILPGLIILNKSCYDYLSTSIQKNQLTAYEILKDQGQHLVDDITFGGLFGGAIIGALQGQRYIGSILSSASLGGLAGLLLGCGIFFYKQDANRH
ncbi:transmembrane protein, putative (macronuclear) [Tetrahymena thermophila SB210]|uniref:Transmembrane protein, putative n=1 Tax=Tetrahymena thermophila (strain SB210) TaxID=312017 RepID=Q22BQ4_TETTS|nr:transmembrane protein, putative [Tetrahymena thermophila SB210]EAR82735.1 transmembrane protein, putative [Tetrahymena thermophila SB210]|eukprot:XP_001030398.1 transmembrane protein, putative [Tetrahymena thermophila SB210]